MSSSAFKLDNLYFLKLNLFWIQLQLLIQIKEHFITEYLIEHGLA